MLYFRPILQVIQILMSKSRRDFIKISALGSAGILWGSQFIKGISSTEVPGKEDIYYLPNDATRTSTYCEVCFWKCAGWVYKDEKSNIQKVIGNDLDPNCNGRLCPRGTGGIGMYYDKDRLKTPLIRTGERGSQTFREATWEEAFKYIAEKVKTIKVEHGGHSFALFNHGSGGKYFSKLLKGLGSDNIAAPSYAQCRGPREVAFIATFGMGLESPENTDIRDTRFLLLIGPHLGDNMQNGQVQEISDAN